MSTAFQADPGPPPRSIELRRFARRLPAMVQFSLVMFPPLILAAGVWLPLGGGRTALFILVLFGLVLAGNLYRAWSFGRKLTHYPALLGVVAGFSNPPDDRISHLTIMHFDFEVQGSRFRGQHLSAARPAVFLGEPIWVLYNPRHPADAIPWLDR